MKKLLFRILAIGWATLTWCLTTTPDFHPSSDTLLSFLLSNGGHFVFFGILAVLLQLSLTIYDNLLTKYLPIILTTLYGILIELVQRSIPGRSFSLFDWFLDILGALVFLHFFNKLKFRI